MGGALAPPLLHGRLTQAASQRPYAETMISFDRPARSLLVFLAVVVAVGAVLGEVVSAAILALFLYLLSSVNAKPSWRRWFDPDRRGESGGLRFVSWRRPRPGSPSGPQPGLWPLTPKTPPPEPGGLCR